MGLSERRACSVVGADRKMIRYRSRRPPDTELRARLRELANQRRRFGYRRLFVLLRREGDPRHADAARLLEEIEAGHRRSQPANLMQATALHQRGQIAEAENAYRAILKADPNQFDATYLLGVIFLQQHKFESAERQIGLAIRLQPNIAAPHYNRGVALTFLDRQEEALASFNAAIALKPDYDLAITQRNKIIESSRNRH